MQVSLHNRVKAYNLTAGKSLPEWLSERRKNRRAADDVNRVELLHDLEFPHCAKTIFRCPNGTHLFAAGDYPYRLKCFDVNELSMKYSFNADMEILSGVCLSADYRKFALRGAGRQITVHHSAAIVERVRVPHMQRCLAYNPFCAELLSSGASHEVFRINLETGAFVESYSTGSHEGVNHVEVCEGGPASGVVLMAGCDGVLEAWDSRSASCAARLAVSSTTPGASATSTLTSTGTAMTGELRHVAVEQGGSSLRMACGTEHGEVLLYDMRLGRPLLVKDHMNGLPIVKTYFFHGRSSATGESSFVLSADTRSVKVWNKEDGGNFTSIEAPGDITDFCLLRSQHNLVPPYDCSDSGVIAVCCDVPRVQVHFIPQLGAAPRWAAFLESLTEELEGQDITTVYDDFTFISKEEMDSIGVAAEDLAGGKIRPVMHGAFIEKGLYRELRAVVNPGEFSDYVADNARRRKELRWSDRISKFKRVPLDSASRLGEESGADGVAATAGTATSDLARAKADPRFAKAFDATTGKASATYALDRNNPEYAKLLQKIDEQRSEASTRRERYDKEMFTVMPAAAESGDSDADEAREHLRGVQSSGVITRRHRRKQAVERAARLAAGGSRATSASEGANGPSAVSHKDGNRQGMTGYAGGGRPTSSHSSTSTERVVTAYTIDHAHAGVFTRNDKQIHAMRKKLRAEKLSLEERLKRSRAS